VARAVAEAAADEARPTARARKLAHRHQLGLTGPKDQAAGGAQLIRDRPPGGDGKQVHHPVGLANDPTAGQNYTAQQAGSEEAG